MALTLHHLERSRSHRIIWLFEELGLDYEMKRYARHRKTMRADPALRDIHPLGKAPVVTDDALVLAETGAIIEYVLERYGEGRLQPPAGDSGDQARVDYRFFMHYAEGSLMPPLLVRLIFDTIEKAKVPFFVKPLIGQVVRRVDENFIDGEMSLHADFLEKTLEKQKWFAGEAFTAADIQMSFPVEGLLRRGAQGRSKTHHLRAFVDRIRDRPAYRQALEKGGDVF